MKFAVKVAAILLSIAAIIGLLSIVRLENQKKEQIIDEIGYMKMSEVLTEEETETETETEMVTEAKSETVSEPETETEMETVKKEEKTNVVVAYQVDSSDYYGTAWRGQDRLGIVPVIVVDVNKSSDSMRVILDNAGNHASKVYLTASYIDGDLTEKVKQAKENIKAVSSAVTDGDTFLLYADIDSEEAVAQIEAAGVKNIVREVSTSSEFSENYFLSVEKLGNDMDKEMDNANTMICLLDIDSDALTSEKILAFYDLVQKYQSEEKIVLDRR